MKPFSQPSIDRLNRLAQVAMVATAVIFSGLSCVSEPASATGDTATEAPAVAEPLAKVVEPVIQPEIAAMYRPAPATRPGHIRLEEPAPPPVIRVAPASAPSDITVLSSLPPPRFPPLALPEPVAPAPKPAPLPAPKPATAKPLVPAPKPAAAPAPKPATATAPEKPAPAKPLAAKAETTVPAEPPKSAIVLPSSPSSSTQSVVAAAARPMAETRVETVRGEHFELRFPGTGWIYLGDETGQDGLRYETRRFEGSQAVFAMNPERAGEYLLRFQRQNPVDRSTEVSLVRVVVAEKTLPAISVDPAPAPASTTAAAGSAAVTPDGATAVATPVATAPGDASAAQSALAEPSAPASQAVTPLPSSVATVTDPSVLLRMARDELEAKRVQSAIDALDRYLSLYPYGNDEVFYLYGLAYEQDTPFRNIKKAWDNYRRVRDEYPRSVRWREAADRIAYLERHYFGLR